MTSHSEPNVGIPTTLRAIEPISIADLDTASPESGEPICERIDPRSLFVDPAYQREIGERGLRQIRRIVEAFDWKKFKPPICAYAEHQGRTVLKVIDGQHTAIACASHPQVDKIPVMIVEAGATEEQADAFVGQNTARLGVTALQIHKAAVAANDPDAITVEQVCQRAGVKVLLYPPARGVYKPRETVAIGTLKWLVDRHGAMKSRMILDVLANADLAPIKDMHIRAAELLMTGEDYRDAFEPVDLTGEIVTAGKTAEHEAKLLTMSHNMPGWRALAITWFKKTKKKRGALKAVA
ncbi:MAG: hypothetical protein KDK08_18295 [Rhizobiaceae bacterium]|nr:hypothetical protein [Rhizobiaceae bacterium]